MPVRAAHRIPARPDSDEAPQLGDRLRVILDAEVADAVDPFARLAPRSDSLDDDSGGLLAALVAPGGLPCLERRDETMCQWADRLLERLRHLFHHRRSGEDVPLYREARADAMACPVEALGPGEGGSASIRGDHTELARLASGVVGEHVRERVLGRGAALELIECLRTVDGDAGRLRRRGA